MATTEKNIFKAIMLSICFGLGGCILFGIFYLNGLIAQIGAYLIFFLASLGYKKFNANVLDKKGYFTLLAITIVELILTILISRAIYYMINLDIGFFDSLSFVIELLSSNDEFCSGVISDIVTSVLFVLIAVIVDVVSAKKRQKNVEMNNNAESNNNQNQSELTFDSVEDLNNNKDNNDNNNSDNIF